MNATQDGVPRRPLPDAAVPAWAFHRGYEEGRAVTVQWMSTGPEGPAVPKHRLERFYKELMAKRQRAFDPGLLIQRAREEYQRGYALGWWSAQAKRARGTRKHR